jgi:RNA polymerase primary sigma factor
VHVTEIVNRARRAQRELTQEIGREPLRGEIAERMGASTETVDRIMSASREPVSLEAPVGEDEGRHLGELIEDTNAERPAEVAAWSQLKDQIGSVLGTLTDRERRIIELRYGLTDDRARTLEEVGVLFHLTRERIRQIESKALSKLRHPSRKQSLAGYFE